MDKDTRNTLRNVVTNCRQLLEEAVAQVLEGQYGVYASGRVDDAATMDHLTPDELDVRERIVTHLEHIQSGGFKPADAADQLIREIAFTHLNRLAAYKMMEQRGLIREAVSRGVKSQGFMFYLADHPDDERLWSTGQQELAYRHFLVWQGEQFADEISVLFSPYDPANFVFPPQRVLDQVLDLINSAELADIWTADETIGWIYQYFTPKELRDKARSESQAPRNSYELAFRNQFYTPRYVVEFLTDNTLGRTWYEMLQGDTALIDRCQYLVRRPKEIFLAQGEDAPENDIDTSTLSQEELLQQPVYIPYRALKDPRRLKVLDPACGSGHFLLYAFDLLAIIYEEAWERGLTDQELGMRLRDDYATLDDLRRDIPRLILRNNLHGIDIDRRATQIAALALWLRAQRYFNDHQIDRNNRPPITQGNLVLAEPMPGDRSLLDEFVAELEPPIDQMVKRVFNEMKLAGEAGSLLKIEEAIQDDIARAREEWERRLRQQHTPQQMALLPDWIEKIPEQLALFDVSKITDAEFFDRAEHLVLEALKAYAQRAENGYGLRRRLFADDAAGGFAFIELMSQRYDVVLMNPPFGETAQATSADLNMQYPAEASDIGIMFVSRWCQILSPQGCLGAITNRTCLATSQLEKWRREIPLGKYPLGTLADLGYGVLDAVVETAAYVLDNAHFKVDFVGFRMLDSREKGDELLSSIQSLLKKVYDPRAQIAQHTRFLELPLAVISYWAPMSMLRLLSADSRLGNVEPGANDGGHSGDDFRFLRTTWEIPPEKIHSERDFVFFAKGGEYAPIWDDIHLLIFWRENGADVRKIPGARIYHEDLHFKPGLTYPLRTTSDFSPRILPAQIMFSTGGHGIHFNCLDDALIFLGFAYTRFFKVLVEALFGSGDASVPGTAARNYTAGTINHLPLPRLYGMEKRTWVDALGQLISLFQLGFEGDETSRTFAKSNVAWHASKQENIRTSLQSLISSDCDRFKQIAKFMEALESHAPVVFEIPEDVSLVLETIYGVHPCSYPHQDISARLPELLELDLSRMIEVASEATGSRNRSVTKKSFFVDRQLDLLCHITATHPISVCDSWLKSGYIPSSLQKSEVKNLFSYNVGCVLGRWDIRYATGERSTPDLPGPFDPLPVCPPGMLQNAEGLPATETPPGYPIDIDWDGILVDDPDHPDDIIRRVRGVLEVLWGDRAEAIEHEACEILGVKTLRDYFRKPGSGGFWDDHVKRYSKSRRKAPIYWLLQSSRKNYALWLYYHRLDKDLYYKALINYVQPKLRLERSKLDALRAQLKGAGVAGREAKRLEREVEQQEALMSELQDFHDALERAAQLNLKPDLNDGVVLNIAPLHELVPWKEADKYWKALLKGEYEWSTISQQLRDKGLVK